MILDDGIFIKHEKVTRFAGGYLGDQKVGWWIVEWIDLRSLLDG